MSLHFIGNSLLEQNILSFVVSGIQVTGLKLYIFLLFVIWGLETNLTEPPLKCIRIINVWGLGFSLSSA